MKQASEATEMVRVRVDKKEMASLHKQSERAGVTLSDYFRGLAGLSPRKRGGAREGAGRPKKKASK